VEPLLLANFPNPFNPETWIPFALAESGPVTFTIYDVSGRSVRTLHLGALPAAWYDTRDTAAHWDGRNDAGERVVSGVYIAELDAGGAKTRQRMVLRK
jgi:flagellar hook assembly protein FlgD